MSFHRVAARQFDLACDACGGVIDPTDIGRSAHQAWHDRQQVIDLRVDQLTHAS